MITFDRLFCDPDSNDPYEDIEWVCEDAEIMGTDDTPVFSQASVEFPVTWSQRARNIVASKYFYGSGDTRESSLRQIIDRVVDTISRHGLHHGYFGGQKQTEDEFATYTTHNYPVGAVTTEKDFCLELKALLVNQYASFNSPVWFNIGVEGVQQQGSACFINHVEDSMDSILELSMAEGRIFKCGSGAGVNVSRLRGKGEPLSGGGTSSGPISFMKGLDAQAGVIKSGGVTRRAAKMVLMDVDHPDIMAFIRCKNEEECKARALIDAGYDSAIDGEAYASVFFQNANHSVRLTDDFMEAAVASKNQLDKTWKVRRRTDNAEVDVRDAEGFTPSAHDILREIAETAWACGDPGVQFTDTINAMHTCAGTDPIRASNPCSEFVFLDNTACNLASINVLKYWDGASFDWQKLLHTVDLLITAQDILVDYSDYPTEDIGAMTKNTRPLGLGITNLGALLMAMGLPYDSTEGRDFAAVIMAAITGEAYGFSAVLAAELGAFTLYHKDSNNTHMLDVIDQHTESANALVHRISLCRSDQDRGVWTKAIEIVEPIWEVAQLLGAKHGYRNAQVTVIAPTGTIAFMMDCDTTGVEPLLAPAAYKTLVGGGSFTMRAKCFEDGKRIVHDIELGKRKYVTKKEIEQHPILATALGDNTLTPEAHLRMLEVLQPFVSGAISKTINMPADATVDDVETVIRRAWQEDVKCVAIYRDGSKGSQPVSAITEKKTMYGVSNIVAEEDNEVGEAGADCTTADPTTSKFSDVAADPAVIAEIKADIAYTNPLTQLARRKPGRRRNAVTHKFNIGGHEGYLTVGLFENGDVAEVFVNMAKEGSTISGLLGQWAMTISLAIQYGVPLEVLIDKHSYVRYEPAGFTGDEQIKNAYSITDYIMRWIAANTASFKEGKDLGKVLTQHPGPSTPIHCSDPISNLTQKTSNGNLCSNCNGILMVQGNCHVCTTCGDATGCG